MICNWKEDLILLRIVWNKIVAPDICFHFVCSSYDSDDWIIVLSIRVISNCSNQCCHRQLSNVNSLVLNGLNILFLDNSLHLQHCTKNMNKNTLSHLSLSLWPHSSSSFNSLMFDDAHKRQRNGSSLVQPTPCSLFGAIHCLMQLLYCVLDSWQPRSTVIHLTVTQILVPLVYIIAISQVSNYGL